MSGWRAGRAVLLGLLLGLLVTQIGFSLMRVDGRSMDPSLFAGELVVVLRPPVTALLASFGSGSWGQVERGAMVVLPEPHTGGVLLGMGRPLIVKRVVALPNELVAFRRGQLYVDGVRLPEPWVSEERRGTYTMPPRPVDAGEVFVVGDNRLPLASRDSRQFGPVPTSSLRGRLVAQLRLPWGPEGLRWPVVGLL